MLELYFLVCWRHVLIEGDMMVANLLLEVLKKSQTERVRSKRVAVVHEEMIWISDIVP